MPGRQWSENNMGVQPSASPARGAQRVRITVNGECREVLTDLSVWQLLQQLELGSPHVAVEVNLQLVPRAQHSQHVLQQGDRVEVVTLVGGG